MGEAGISLRFNVNRVWTGSASIASTRCGWLMHAQVPAKAREVRKAFAAISTAIKRFGIRRRGVWPHRALVIGFREMRIISNED